MKIVVSKRFLSLALSRAKIGLAQPDEIWKANPKIWKAKVIEAPGHIKEASLDEKARSLEMHGPRAILFHVRWKLTSNDYDRA